MADILDEIKDDIKQEKYENLITNHGFKLFLAALVIVVSVAGAKIYESVKFDDAIEKGRVFYKAFEDSKPELYNEVISADHEGYKILATFSKAGISKSKDEVDKAIKTLEDLKSVSSENKALKDYAKLTSLFLIASTEDKWRGKEADINADFESLYTGNSPFALSAKQAHAVFLNKIGQKTKAKSLFSDIALTEDTPPSMVKRAKTFIKIIDGDK